MAPSNRRVPRHHDDSLSSTTPSMFISSTGSLCGPGVFAIPPKHSQSYPKLGSRASEESGPPNHKSRCLVSCPTVPWLPLITITLTNVLMGLNLYSMGFFFAEITRSFGASQGSGGLMSALQMALSHILAVFLSGPVSRWDYRPVSAVGCLVLLSGLLCSCFAPSVSVLYFTYGIVPGIGLCILYLETITLSQKLFVNHRALLTSITYMGYSIGHLVAPSLSVYLLETYGWRGALLIHTAILSHVMIFVMTFRAPARQTISIRRRTSVNKGSGILVLTHENVGEYNMSEVGNGCNVESKRKDKGLKANLKDKEEEKEEEQEEEKEDGEEAGQEDLVKRQFEEESPMIINISNEESEDTKSEPFDTRKYVHEQSHLSQRLSPEPTEATPDPEVEDLTASGTTRQQARGCVALLSHSKDLRLMRNLNFVLYNVSTLLIRIPSTAFIVLLPSVLIHNGYTLHQAAALASIVSVFNTCLRPLVGLIADHVNRYLCVFIGAVLCAVANALLLFSSVYWVAVTACAMYGIYMATWNTLVAVVLVDLVGMDNIARSYGINSVFFGTATLIGPSVAGWLYDINGDYLVTLCTMAAIAAVGSSFIVIIYLLSRKSSPNVANPRH